MRSFIVAVSFATLALALGGCDPTAHVHVVPTDGSDKGKCLHLAFPGGKEASEFWVTESWKYAKWADGVCDTAAYPTVVATEKDYDGWTSQKNSIDQKLLCGGVVLTKSAAKAETVAEDAFVAPATGCKSDDDCHAGGDMSGYCKANGDCHCSQPFFSTSGSTCKLSCCPKPDGKACTVACCRDDSDCQSGGDKGAYCKSPKSTLHTTPGNGQCRCEAGFAGTTSCEKAEFPAWFVTQVAQLTGGKCDPTAHVHVVPTDGSDKGKCLHLAVPGGKEASEFWATESWKYAKWADGVCDTAAYPTVVATEKDYDGWTSQKNSIDQKLLCGGVVLTKSTAKAETIAEVYPLQDSPSPYYHGVSDTQCRETTLPQSGVSDPGECPDVFDIREKQEVDTVCRTGGNLKFCKPADIMNITVTTWGESGWMHVISGNHCIEANFTLPGVNETGLCPTKQYSLVLSDDVSTVCRDGANLKYCTPRDVLQVEVRTRGDK